MANDCRRGGAIRSLTSWACCLALGPVPAAPGADPGSRRNLEKPREGESPGFRLRKEARQENRFWKEGVRWAAPRAPRDAVIMDAVAGRPRDAVAGRPRDAVAWRPRDAVAGRPRDAVARRRRPGPPAAGAGSAASRSPTPPSPAALARRPQEPLMPDEVHQNQILREVYLKELRTQKLSTEYHVNPLRKVHTITRKPMSWHENLEEPADARFLNLIHHAAQGPRKKYPDTQTESQEIGWDSEPLVSPERDDRRLNHFRVHSDITLYKAKVWSLGEDDRHT
ncbi:protein FAM183A isoform X1 [Canis lupus familiaris]|uniref:protein FAM183A isoform X1 n=2 Tax=Canis lupus familiaris TaxID=9615 RepID=UPI0018F36E38|nr:protein FAM183A isoform X1 [Canis lupus familiaris]XP_013975223.2 protein FAM183A isoform X1 [Canis lupus familiaris]XP_013975224.2 protein FAM183A isoform X1 [Canis lupus familiaris]XP_022283781.2 protein FAM183A isoform X1 [Canis lupus familiaris]XP_038543922.1 protein FAM183A isoform X1 [Canis lupus familiaris]XP_038543923.1 protein FAM183A isoform X1 [Canis lupus familiaris]XP_038543924.1 protein FAM183A isoform X1 [Canis lupus familiaris]